MNFLHTQKKTIGYLLFSIKIIIRLGIANSIILKWFLPTKSVSKIYFIKNISSSTSHNKTLKLRDFSFLLSSTLIYEAILIKIYINADIMKTHIFHKMKHDLKGHIRSSKNFKIIFFCDILFVKRLIFFKKFKRYDFKGHLKISISSFSAKDHFYVKNLSTTFVYGPILIKICETQFFIKLHIWPEMSLYDLITTLTYDLIENICHLNTKL